VERDDRGLMPISESVTDAAHYPADSVYARVEGAAQKLYVDALKVFPPDVKDALARARAAETSANGIDVLDVMLETIDVAERDQNLVCQDTGTVVYWVEAGQDSPLELARIAAAVRRGTERATLEHPLRSNTVHPLTREHTRTNTGRFLPAMHYEFVEGRDVTLHCLPKGSGCENMSFLKMLVPADGVRGVKRFILDCLVEAAGKPCPPGICGVGLGGTADLCATLAKRALLRPIGRHNEDPVVAALEDELFALANELGIGPMGLGGATTLLALHIEHAHTHITQNPVAVCMQCWAARRASARVAPDGAIVYGF
jgi:tartrate/fumarate subfamily iron-sulfur-dependent hydro-lyase alpha chain